MKTASLKSSSVKKVKLTRRSDWTDRLYAYVKASRKKSFVWGKHDCLTFTCGCIRAITDTDFTLPFKGRYHTVEGAHRTLRRNYKVDTLTEAVDKILGDSIRSEEARRGDLMMVNTDLGDTFGILLGKQIIFVSPEGLSFLPWTDALKAWRVG